MKHEGVEYAGGPLDPGCIPVYDDHVMPLARKHLGYVEPDFPCADDNYPH